MSSDGSAAPVTARTRAHRRSPRAPVRPRRARSAAGSGLGPGRPDDNAFAVGRSIVVSRVCIEQTLECSLATRARPPRTQRWARHDRAGPAEFPFIPARGWVARFLSGELALVWARVGWGGHFRRREHDADSYAARLGCAEELADYFESVVSYDRAVPFRWLSDAQHPPTEYRIERLRQAGSAYDQPEGDLT